MGVVSGCPAQGTLFFPRTTTAASCEGALAVYHVKFLQRMLVTDFASSPVLRVGTSGPTGNPLFTFWRALAIAAEDETALYEYRYQHFQCGRHVL